MQDTIKQACHLIHESDTLKHDDLVALFEAAVAHTPRSMPMTEIRETLEKAIDSNLP